MKRVIVASKNPVKLEAVRRGFADMFPGETVTLEGLSVPSGVAVQPRTDEETRRGAENRAQAARRLAPQADYWVGVEGGVAEADGEMSTFAWVAVLSPQGSGKGRSGAFSLPRRVADMVRSGLELGEADDIVFGQVNSKQVNGAIGLLTGNAIDRAGLYAPAVVMALIPFKNPELYFEGE